MSIKKLLEGLRDAAHNGDDLVSMWQNLVDYHTSTGCHPDVTFYIKDWWEVNRSEIEIDWVCAQWFDLPDSRWEKEFAEKHANSTSWRYIVKQEGDDFPESYYIQKYSEHDESMMPTTNVSWLELCALVNQRSFEMGLEPVYYFNEDKTPLVEITTSLDDIESLYEDENANGVRLPTKEEWVNACLAGRKGQDTPWGNHDDFEDSFKALDPYVVCWENSAGKMQKVGTKLPNQWGLFDMLGNTFEFTSEEA